MRLIVSGIAFLVFAPPLIAQPLIEAVKAHDLQKVKIILSSPVDINQKGGGGLTPLLLAVRTSDALICKELLDQGADPNAKGDSTLTPLMEASIRGNYSIVESLLKKGADVNACAKIVEGPDGEPLSNPRLMLTGYPISIHAVEKSPLILAAEGEHMAVARLLVDHGADANRQAEWTVTIADSLYTMKGRSPLMCAVQERFPGLVKLLLQKKADVSFQERVAVMPWTSRDAMIARDPDRPGRPLFLRHSTALHLAAEVCDKTITGYLIEAGADLEMRDGTGATPLATAIRNGCTPSAELLIERGADVNGEKNTLNSPLILAAERGKSRLVDILIRAGAAIDQKAGEEGYPLLSWAVIGGNRQVVRTLLEHGANVNAPSKNNSTPLMIAAAEGETNIVRLLISWKARLNAKNNEGQTALMMASKKGRRECVQALLLGGADPTVRDNGGKTAVAHAMLEGDSKTVKVLLEGGTPAARAQWIDNERLADLIDYFSTQIDQYYYSESQYLALAKPYGKWDVRPLHVASLPHPEGDNAMGAAEVPEFVWEVIARRDFNLPLHTARDFRSEFVKEGFAHKERYVKNFYPPRRAAFLALCLQAEQSPRSIYVQQRDLTGREVYERVDNVFRQNKTYWLYAVPPGSPFQVSSRIDTLRGYRYTSSDESILQGLSGTGCYCMVKVKGCVVFMTGGVLDKSIGFIYSKTKPRNGSLGPLFKLALVEELGDGFYYYVSR